MAILTIAGIAGLASTSWELGELNILGTAGTPTRDERIHFGTAVLNPTDVTVQCDREINCTDQNGCTLTADEGVFGDAENIKFNWAASIQTIQSIDLTGTKLTLNYSVNYYEVYNLIP